MVEIIFQASETTRESHTSGPMERTFGPFAWAQWTFTSLRAGPGHPSLQEDEEIAHLDRACECWVLDTDMGRNERYSDVIITEANPK